MRTLQQLYFRLHELTAMLGSPRSQTLRISTAPAPSGPGSATATVFWVCGCSAEEDPLTGDYDWHSCLSHSVRRRVKPAV